MCVCLFVYALVLLAVAVAVVVAAVAAVAAVAVVRADESSLDNGHDTTHRTISIVQIEQVANSKQNQKKKNKNKGKTNIGNHHPNSSNKLCLLALASTSAQTER